MLGFRRTHGIHATALLQTDSERARSARNAKSLGSADLVYLNDGRLSAVLAPRLKKGAPLLNDPVALVGRFDLVLVDMSTKRQSFWAFPELVYIQKVLD